MNSLKINHLALFFSLALLLVFCKNEGVKEVKSGNPNDLVRLPTNPDGSVDTTKVAKMTFEEATFDFDTIEEGAVVEHEFKFKNTGPVALIIADAKSTCGCTIPQWPTEPVKPGESSSIKAKFNSSHKSGRQNKAIRIFANTYPTPAMVALVGFVHSKEEEKK